MSVVADQIAKRLGIDRERAEELLAGLVQHILSETERGETFKIAGLGTFVRDNGRIVFEPDPRLASVVNHRFAGLAPISVDLDPDGPRAGESVFGVPGIPIAGLQDFEPDIEESDAFYDDLTGSPEPEHGGPANGTLLGLEEPIEAESDSDPGASDEFDEHHAGDDWDTTTGVDADRVADASEDHDEDIASDSTMETESDLGLGSDPDWDRILDDAMAAARDEPSDELEDDAELPFPVDLDAAAAEPYDVERAPDEDDFETEVTAESTTFDESADAELSEDLYKATLVAGTESYDIEQTDDGDAPLVTGDLDIPAGPTEEDTRDAYYEGPDIPVAAESDTDTGDEPEAVPPSDAAGETESARDDLPAVVSRKRRNAGFYIGLIGLLIAAIAIVLWVIGQGDDDPIVPLEEMTVQEPVPPQESASESATPAAVAWSPGGIDLATGGYTIVVGSESNESLAAALAGRVHQNLAGEGYPVDVLRGTASGRTRFRVAVGQFRSQSLASREMRRLSNLLPEGSWILRIRRNM